MRFFWNVAKFQAKLASVNGNLRNVAIFHHVTLGTSGLLATRALWNVYRYPRPSCIRHALHAWMHALQPVIAHAHYQPKNHEVSWNWNFVIFRASVNGRNVNAPNIKTSNLKSQDLYRSPSLGVVYCTQTHTEVKESRHFSYFSIPEELEAKRSDFARYLMLGTHFAKVKFFIFQFEGKGVPFEIENK